MHVRHIPFVIDPVLAVTMRLGGIPEEISVFRN